MSHLFGILAWGTIPTIQKGYQMAPAARKPLTLGFIGRGAASAKNAAALLADLIEADSGKARVILPATKEHWTEGIEAVADFALENGYPVTLVTDDSTNDVKPLKGYLSQATEKIKVVNPVNKVVTLTAEGSGKLIMLWDDEDDDCYEALDLAESNGIEALDLTAGLHKLEFTGDAPVEPEDDADPEVEAEPEDDLDDLDEDQLQEIADSLGLNVEDYPEWDDVREAIREERRIQGEDGGEDEGLPTVEALETWDFAALKAFAQENGIEVPPRSKTFGYKKAITEFLESAAAHTEALDAEATDMPDDDDGELDLPADDTDAAEVTHIIDLTPVAEEMKEGNVAILSSLTDLHNAVGEIRDVLETLSRGITEKMIEIRTAIMEIGPQGTVQKAQQAIKDAEEKLDKAVEPRAVARKAGAAQKPAAATKKVNRPGPMPKAPEPAERPLAPFMHLLGKKLTKAQAKEIQIAAALRGRGRPSEDERALIAQAREVVPNL